MRRGPDGYPFCLEMRPASLPVRFHRTPNVGRLKFGSSASRSCATPTRLPSVTHVDCDEAAHPLTSTNAAESPARLETEPTPGVTHGPRCATQRRDCTPATRTPHQLSEPRGNSLKLFNFIMWRDGFEPSTSGLKVQVKHPFGLPDAKGLKDLPPFRGVRWSQFVAPRVPPVCQRTLPDRVSHSL